MEPLELEREDDPTTTTDWHDDWTNCCAQMRICCTGCWCGWWYTHRLALRLWPGKLGKTAAIVLLCVAAVSLAMLAFDMAWAIQAPGRTWGTSQVERPESSKPPKALAMAYIAGLFAVSLLIFVLRRRMRHVYRIRGSDEEDCVLASCCQTCVVCQMQRHAESRRRDEDGVYATPL